MKNRRMAADGVDADDRDRAIINELQKNGRLALTELGKKIGVSHGTVRYRLERLLKDRVLEVVAVVDPGRVGFPTQVLIGIGADLGSMNAVEKRLSALDEVFFVAALAGRLDFMIGAAFASDIELRDFLARRLSKIEGVRSTETFHILGMAKRRWHWRAPAVSKSERKRDGRRLVTKQKP